MSMAGRTKHVTVRLNFLMMSTIVAGLQPGRWFNETQVPRASNQQQRLLGRPGESKWLTLGSTPARLRVVAMRDT